MGGSEPLCEGRLVASGAIRQVVAPQRLLLKPGTSFIWTISGPYLQFGTLFGR